MGLRQEYQGWRQRRRLAITCRAAVELMTDYLEGALSGKERDRRAVEALKEVGLEPIAIFDDEGGHRFLGMPVRPIAEHADVPYDVIVVATLEVSGQRLANLMRDGVPPEKVFPLRRTSAQPSLPAVATRSVAGADRR